MIIECNISDLSDVLEQLTMNYAYSAIKVAVTRGHCEIYISDGVN